MKFAAEEDCGFIEDDPGFSGPVGGDVDVEASGLGIASITALTIVGISSVVRASFLLRLSGGADDPSCFDNSSVRLLACHLLAFCLLEFL